MKQIEANIIKSFNGMKYDLASIHTKIYEIMHKNEELERTIFILQGQLRTPPRTIIKTKIKNKGIKIFGSKEGNKYHRSSCPFAKNIKAKSKIIFSTKKIAEKKGYRPCKCLK